jgi:hypothetical protein
MANAQDGAAVINGATGSEVLVNNGGYACHVPLAIAQSFSKLQSWYAVNFPLAPAIPAGDQTGWTNIMAGLGITMGA